MTPEIQSLVSDLRAKADAAKAFDSRLCSVAYSPDAILTLCDAIRLLCAEATAHTNDPSAGDACAHYWHQWGQASGGMSSDGSSHSSGTLRCCHCGESQSYDYHSTPQRPVTHGKFYGEILGFLA